MADTHINAFVQEARERLLTAEAALRDAQASLEDLVAKQRGDTPEEVEPPKDPSPADEGESKKKAKYR